MNAKIASLCYVSMAILFCGCGAAMQGVSNLANNQQAITQLADTTQSIAKTAANKSAANSSNITASKKGVIIAIKDLTDAEYNTALADTVATLGAIASVASAFVPATSMLNANAQNLANVTNNLATVKASNASKQIVAQEIKVKLENGHEVIAKQPINLTGARKLKSNHSPPNPNRNISPTS